MPKINILKFHQLFS